MNRLPVVWMSSSQNLRLQIAAWHRSSSRKGRYRCADTRKLQKGKTSCVSQHRCCLLGNRPCAVGALLLHCYIVITGDCEASATCRGISPQHPRHLSEQLACKRNALLSLLRKINVDCNQNFCSVHRTLKTHLRARALPFCISTPFGQSQAEWLMAQGQSSG